MESSDIQYSISGAIDDILSLINYCSTNKSGRNLCSKRSFWEQQFNKFNLPLQNNVQYNNPYEWIQLLLKTKYIIDHLNQLNTTQKIKSATLNVNIPFFTILQIMKNENIIDKSIEHYFDDDYNDNDEFMEAINNHYPLIINNIIIQKRGNNYSLILIINKDIENIPGGIELLQDGDEIVFTFNMKKYQLEDVLINLISYM